jgi:hypothetical protein
MDLFLSDVFDCASADAIDELSARFLFFRESATHPTGQQPALRTQALLASPELASNLAFHEGWRAACGTRPTREDFVGSGGGSIDALQRALIAFSPIRVTTKEIAETLLRRAVEAHGRTLASLNAASGFPSVARRLLLDKLADRFGLAECPPSLVDQPLVSAYASLVCGDPLLSPLERWYETAADTSAPPTVAEYYARVTAAAVRIGLPWQRSPLSGWGFPGGKTTSPRLSCVELLRLPINRDGLLARQDSGGALLLLSPFESPSSALAADGIRTAVAPASLVLASVPTILYRRIAIGPGHDIAGIFIRPPGVELVFLGANDAADIRTAAVACPPGRAWLPPAKSFGGAEGASFPSWADELRSSMLGGLVRHGPHRLSEVGELVARDFVVRFACARQLGAARYDGLAPADDVGGSVGEVVLVDDRPNVWSAMAMLVTLDNLRLRPDAGAWSASIFTSARAAPTYRRWLAPHAPHLRVAVLEDELPGDGKFDPEAYNALLKRASFWRRILAPRALVIQEDGMLARRGLEDDAELMAQAFVGAPWAPVVAGLDNWAVLRAAGVAEGSFVGNGGFSLRSTAAMVAACEAAEKDGHGGKLLFNSDIQPQPEDVFFAAAAAKAGRACPRPVAARFSFEEELPAAGSTTAPFGFHKPWAYLPMAEVAGVLRSYL